MSCKTKLDIAFGSIVTATGLLAATAAVVLAASIANATFFGIPAAIGLMTVAFGIASGALAALLTAGAALTVWRLTCLARDCTNNFSAVAAWLAGATASVSALVYMCAVDIGIAAIPVGGAVALGYLDVAIILAAASIAEAFTLWDSLGACQERVAKAHGALQPGENETDPWFLRIKPKTPPAYERYIKTKGPVDDVSHSQWLECKMFDVDEWEVGAIAYIVGTPTTAIAFKWKFDGKAVPASAVQTAGTTSTLTLDSPPLPTTAKLSVTAIDGGGFSRTMTVEVDLASKAMGCHLILHFVPPMYDLPKHPPGPVEIPVEMENFLEALHVAMKPRVTSRF